MDKMDLNKYRTSRCGHKLTILNDSRIVTALPTELQEKAWSEILQNEEVDLFIFEIREEIVEEAMKICYEAYMERQAVSFTVECAVRAWLKLIDWNFYRHDPGDEKGASPVCFIPNSEESWIPDELPDPSPKDSWAATDAGADCYVIKEVVLRKSPSSSSLEYPAVEKISTEYRFPGKVQVEIDTAQDEVLESTFTYASSSFLESSVVGSSSEVLERVTDYPAEQRSASQVLSNDFNYESASSTTKTRKTSTPPTPPAPPAPAKPKNKPKKKSRTQLPPLEGPLPPRPSAVTTLVSDHKLRSLRKTSRTLGGGGSAPARRRRPGGRQLPGTRPPHARRYARRIF